MIYAIGFTDKGNRQENQDDYAIAEIERGVLAVVADGVGGNSGGKIAASIAIQEFQRIVTSDEKLIVAVNSAHEKILEIGFSSPDLNGLATTVSAVVCEAGHLHGVSCGDSRVYLLRNNGLKQLSTDHSEYMRLLHDGKLTREDAVNYPRRNILYSALGINKPLVVDRFTSELMEGDRVVVLTDGIHSVLGKRQVRDISIRSHTLEEFCESLKREVISAGPRDNYTLVALQI